MSQPFSRSDGDGLLVLEEGELDSVTLKVVSIARRHRLEVSLYPSFIDVGPISFLFVKWDGVYFYQSLYKVRVGKKVNYVDIPIELDR